MWRDYKDNLQLTFSLDPQPASQPYFEYGQPTSPPGGTMVSFALLSKFQTQVGGGLPAAYNFFYMPVPGK